MDGRPVERVVRGLPAPWQPATAFHALARLMEEGAVEETPLAAPARPLRLQVVSLGPDPGPLERRVGLREGANAEASPDLVLVLVDTPLDPRLDAWAEQGRDRTWAPVLVNPADQRLGPWFHASRGPCWGCLRTRLELNDAGAMRTLEAPLELTWNFLAVEIRRIQAGTSGFLEGRMWRHADGAASAHPVVESSECPQCGASPGEPAPLELEVSPTRQRAGGGYRSVEAESTVARLERHLSPLTGIASDLRRLSPPGDPIEHVYTVRHPFPRTVFARDGEERLPWRSVRSRAGGKGIDAVHARASALGESVERWSGVFRGTEHRRWARFEDFGGEALHPGQVMGFSDAQYAARGPWDPARSLVHFVPRPFDLSAQVEWSPLTSLEGGVRRWLPTALCYYGYPQALDEAMGLADSNGCASGNTLAEAVLQGALELVERDAVALWWYNRVRRPGIDLQDSDEPFGVALRRRFEAQGRDLWVLDVTSDLGIPVYAALSRRHGGGNDALLAGFGAHPDPRVALRRSLTELVEVRHQLFEVDPEGGERLRTEHPEAQAWWAALAAAPQAYLDPFGRVPLPASAWSQADLADDVRALMARLKEQALELLVLDQTRPGLDLRVVRVVIPGLCHFWRRLGHRRLYDVPVKLGWIEKPPREEDLNPVAIFL